MYINEDHMMGPIVSSLLVFSVLKSSNSGWWSTQHQFLKDPGSFSPGFPYGFLQLPLDFPLLGRLELRDKDMLRNQPGLLDSGIRSSGFIDAEESRLLDQGPSAESFVGDALTTYHPQNRKSSPQPSVFFRQAGSFRGGIPQNVISFWLHMHVGD